MAKAKRAAAAGPVEGPWELPEGWRWERLSDLLVAFSAGKRPKGGVAGISEGCLSVGGEHLRWDGSVASENAKFVPFDFAKTIQSAKIIKDDILVVKDGATTGKTAYASTVGEDMFVNEHVFLVRVNPGLALSRFVFFWLWSRFGFNEIMQDFRGAAQGGIGRTMPGVVRVPLPPAETQRAIVARIDELFAEIDDGEAALVRARDDLETWRKALLKAAVTGELTADWRAERLRQDGPPTETGADLLARILADRRARWDEEPRNQGRRYKEPSSPDVGELPALPDGWTWALFDQLVNKLSNGISAKPAHAPPGIPILRISSVRPMLVRRAERRWLPNNFDVGEAVARQGDLLFTRYNGNPELVGVCARYRDEDPIAYPDKVMCATPSSQNTAVGDFLELALNAGESRKFIASYTKTSAGQHGVSGSSVKSAPVPMPPEAEVERIVQVYREVAQQAAGGWSDAEDLALASATLRQSILAAAFRGELA